MIFGDGLMEYFYYKRLAEREKILREEQEARNPWLRHLRREGKLIHLYDVTEEEIDTKMQRTSGDVICGECDKTYREHPYIDNVMFHDQPFLHYICNGILAKL